MMGVKGLGHLTPDFAGLEISSCPLARHGSNLVGAT